MSEALRVTPSSAEAEEAILGCLMLCPTDVHAFITQLGIGPDHFYVPANRLVFDVIEQLIAANAPIEAMAIALKLRDSGNLDAIGGFPRITQINTCVSTAANAEHYASILADKHLARRLISICTQSASAAYDPDASPAALMEKMHGEITSLISRKSKRMRLREVVAEIVEEVRSGRDDAGLLSICHEGIKGRLNLYRGDLFIVSAPTSCGKSALSVQMALDQAAQGRRVALYPLEMAQKQVIKRAIAQLGGNNADWVRSVVQRAGIDAERVSKAMPIVQAFVDTANTILQFDPHLRDDLFTLEAITADIRAEHAKKPFSFVLVDYLQLLMCGGKFERKQAQIAHITQSLKRLASELECVICLPSQVNKQGGTREAEDAENDAAVLVKICGEENEKGDVHPGRVTIWKQREGARHIDLPLAFNGLLTRFEYKP